MTFGNISSCNVQDVTTKYEDIPQWMKMFAESSIDTQEFFKVCYEYYLKKLKAFGNCSMLIVDIK